MVIIDSFFFSFVLRSGSLRFQRAEAFNWVDFFFKQDQGQDKERAKPRLSYSNKAKASARLEVPFICRGKTKASTWFRLICLKQTLASARFVLICLNNAKASARLQRKNTISAFAPDFRSLFATMQ